MDAIVVLYLVSGAATDVRQGPQLRKRAIVELAVLLTATANNLQNSENLQHIDK